MNIDSKFILKLKNKYKKIIGIGETGLDYYYNHSDKEIQKKSFVEHIHAASELNIPVIGLEPSCIFTIRNDYPALIPGIESKTVAKSIMLIDEFLLREQLLLCLRSG